MQLQELSDQEAVLSVIILLPIQQFLREAVPQPRQVRVLKLRPSLLHRSATQALFVNLLRLTNPFQLTGTNAYTGGSFTASPSGLSLNASTGKINPAASNADTYTITYTIPASGGCNAIPVTTSVTITDVPTATIGYAQPFCKSIGSQTVSLSGTGAYSGGTFYSTAFRIVNKRNDGSD